MHGHDLAVSAAENYRAFAEDARVLRFLGTLPPEKRQPNLLFAAARYLLGAPADITGLRALVRQNSAELAGVMMARRTQTNEPARCATLLPALAQLPPPGSPCCSTATPTTTPGTRSRARTPWRPSCAARRADRCPSRTRPGAVRS